jgi:malonyl-CoA O-methyltransferase
MSAVLSIDKNQIRLSFDSAANSYDKFASLQKQVSVDLLAKVNTDFIDDIVVDIGCGTGYMVQQLLIRSSVQQLIAVDIAFSMLQVARRKFNNVQYVCVDAECLPFQNHSVDKIVSNLALQWCENLIQVFNGFHKVLKHQGQLFFSTFGSATLLELKQSWAEVDDNAHVNTFYTADEVFNLLDRAGFKNIQMESKCYQSGYQTVIELMRELKGIGAHNVLSARNRKITGKYRMQKMIDAYEQYRKNGLIPATYEVIFVTAQKIE